MRRGKLRRVLLPGFRRDRGTSESEDRLANLAKHYSEFVVHPIYLRTEETMEVEDEDAEEEVVVAKPSVTVLDPPGIYVNPKGEFSAYG